MAHPREDEIMNRESVSPETVMREAGFVPRPDGSGLWCKPEVLEFEAKHGVTYRCGACGAMWIQKGKTKFCPGCGVNMEVRK